MSAPAQKAGDVRRLFRDLVARDLPGLVLYEVGVGHGTCLVDAVIVDDDHLRGWEFKSDSDSLRRLPAQVAAFSKVLDYATLLVGPRWADKATAAVPAWWGVTVVGGAPPLLQLREPQLNPAHDLAALAQLLWREEVWDALQARELARGKSSWTGTRLREVLVEAVPLPELRSIVRTSMRARSDWCRQHATAVLPHSGASNAA